MRNNSTQKRLLQAPTGLGTAATQRSAGGSSKSAPVQAQIRRSVEPTTQTNVKPVVQNLLSDPTGLGASATKISSLLGKKD